ncbi:type VI secretion system protein TssR domain-containing protein [Aquimarina rhabdastrellae]
MISYIKYNNRILGLKKCYITITAFILNALFFTTVEAQVKKYEKVDKVDRSTYNFLDSYEPHKRQKKDKEFYKVYSDRAHNNVYLDAYAQKKGEEQQFLSPYYVINQENDFYELVKADPSIIGKPKGIFAFLSSGKYTFSDAKTVPYVGWIHKDNLLHFGHPKLSEYNYRPKRYVLGIQDLNTLYQIKEHVKKDSVTIYKDPMFKEKQGSKMLMNQIVYLYKYNEKRTAALVSNTKKIMPLDSLKQKIGWVPSALVKAIGQQQVFAVNNTDSIQVVTEDSIQNKYIKTRAIEGQYLFNLEANHPQIVQEKDTVPIGIPLSVWNHYDNKLINVDGGDVFIREIERIKKEHKVLNFHLAFDCSEDIRRKQLMILTSLQRIWLTLTESEKYKGYKISFSASSFGCGKFYTFPKSESFSAWIDYLQKVFLEDETVETQKRNIEGIAQCFDYALEGIPSKSFSNTIILVSGAKKYYAPSYITPIIHKLGETSSRLIFYQLESKASDTYQEYILQSKAILNNVGKSHADFIRAYIVDNDLIKSNNTFVNIPAQDNIYVYDAPKHSTYQGGIAFPKINKSLLPTSFDTTLDSVLTKTIAFNDTFIKSLEHYAAELGFLRSKPGQQITSMILKDSIYNNKVDFLPRNFMYERYYEDEQLSIADNTDLRSGYLLNKKELENLIDNYKALIPLFAKENLKRKERRVVYRMYKTYIKKINESMLKKSLRKREVVAELIFAKTGLPVQNELFHRLKIRHIKRRVKSSFDEFTIVIKTLRKKIEVLEEKLVDDNTEIYLDGSREKYYFISTQDIL